MYFCIYYKSLKKSLMIDFDFKTFEVCLSLKHFSNIYSLKTLHEFESFICVTMYMTYLISPNLYNMADRLPTRRKSQNNQSINQSYKNSRGDGAVG